MKPLRRTKEVVRNPLTVIELVLAISTIVGGLYVLSPFLVVSIIQNGASPLILALGSQVGVTLFGGIFLASGLASVWGIYTRQYRTRSVAMFIQFLCRFYAIIVGWLVSGLLPLTWLSPLTIAIICVILWLWLKGLVLRRFNE